MDLLEEFKKRANPNNKENVKYNKPTYKIFEQLCKCECLTIFDEATLNKNYILAEEIICNRMAIMSLDRHVFRLMEDVGQLRKKINGQ